MSYHYQQADVYVIIQVSLRSYVKGCAKVKHIQVYSMSVCHQNVSGITVGHHKVVGYQELYHIS